MLPLLQVTRFPLKRNLKNYISHYQLPFIGGLMVCSTLAQGATLEVVPPSANTVQEGNSLSIQVRVAAGSYETTQTQQAGQCTATGRLLAQSPSGGSQVQASDYQFSSEFSVTFGGPTNLGLRATATPSPASATVQMLAVDDHIVEGDEALQIYIDEESVQVTCPSEVSGGVVNVARPYYGPIVTLQDSVQEAVFDTPREALKLLPQLESIAVLTVSGAQARNKTLARQLNFARDEKAARNRQSVTLDGTSLPQFGGAAGDDLNSSWGTFVTGDFELGDRTLGQQNAFDFTTNTLIAGLDYKMGENWVFGGSLSKSKAKADIKNKPDETQLDQNALSVFASFYSAQYYLDMIVTQGTNQYDLLRTDNGARAIANTDGKETSYGIGTGYNVDFTRSTLKLFSRVDYIKADVDGYTETASGLLVPVSIYDFVLKSFTANVGAGWSWVINTNFAVFTPEIGFDFEHQFKGKGFNVDGQFVGGGEPGKFEISTLQKDANYINGNVALNALFPNGISAFASYTGQAQRENWSSDHYALGMRLEF